VGTRAATTARDCVNTLPEENSCAYH